MIDSFIQAKDKQMKEVQANSIFGTQDGIFSAMQTGQIVPDRIKVTPAYAEAKKRIDNVAQFASFTPPQFASAFQNGDLLP